MIKYEKIYRINGEMFVLLEQKTLNSIEIINDKDEYEEYDDDGEEVDISNENSTYKYSYETKYALLSNPDYHTLIISYCNDLEESTDLKVDNELDLISSVLDYLHYEDNDIILRELKQSSVYVSKIPGTTSDILVLKDVNIDTIKDFLDIQDKIISSKENNECSYKYRIYKNGKLKRYTV